MRVPGAMAVAGSFEGNTNAVPLERYGLSSAALKEWLGENHHTADERHAGEIDDDHWIAPFREIRLLYQTKVPAVRLTDKWFVARIQFLAGLHDEGVHGIFP